LYARIPFFEYGMNATVADPVRNYGCAPWFVVAVSQPELRLCPSFIG